MPADVLADRALGDEQQLGDGGVDVALGHQLEHLAFTRGERVQGPTPVLGEELRDHIGIEGGAARGDAAEAERLAGNPGKADAIGVLAEPGVDVGTLRARVGAALEGTGARVHAGDDRGLVEFLDVADARALLIALSGSFGGVALMVALFVVASTFALLVQQRAREIALLRAVAATPRQVRRMICREAQVVAVVAGILGAIPAVALAGWMRAQFVDRGLLPDAFALYVSPLPVLVAAAAGLGTAWLAAWVAARRASRIRPTEALGEAAVEPKRMGPGRLIAGLAVLMLGVGLLAGVAALGMTAIMLPTRSALRSNPAEAINIRE